MGIDNLYNGNYYVEMQGAGIVHNRINGVDPETTVSTIEYVKKGIPHLGSDSMLKRAQRDIIQSHKSKHTVMSNRNICGTYSFVIPTLHGYSKLEDLPYTDSDGKHHSNPTILASNNVKIDFIYNKVEMVIYFELNFVVKAHIYNREQVQEYKRMLPNTPTGSPHPQHGVDTNWNNAKLYSMERQKIYLCYKQQTYEMREHKDEYMSHYDFMLNDYDAKNEQRLLKDIKTLISEQINKSLPFVILLPIAIGVIIEFLNYWIKKLYEGKNFVDVMPHTALLLFICYTCYTVYKDYKDNKNNSEKTPKIDLKTVGFWSTAIFLLFLALIL